MVREYPETSGENFYKCLESHEPLHEPLKRLPMQVGPPKTADEHAAVDRCTKWRAEALTGAHVGVCTVRCSGRRLQCACT